MENLSTLKPVQKVAIVWLKNIDSQLILFNQLKTLNQGFRFFLYAALIIFAFFFMKFVSSLVGGYFESAPMPGLWYFIGNIIFYSVVAGAFLIVSLEAVFNLDVAQIFKDKKAKKAEIGAKKLQRFRLRNMNIFLRIFIYISLYMFMFFIIETSANGAYNDIFGMAPNNEITQAQKIYFISEYNKFVQWFTFLYIISGLTLDYFVNKKRTQKRMEAQNAVPSV